MQLPELAVRRPLFVVVIFAVITVFSSYAFTLIPIDAYPEIEMPMITVVSAYPGASAMDVEEKVTDLLEAQLAKVQGIEEIRSISAEGLASITLQFEWGYDLDEAANDIRSTVSFVADSLPEDATDPVVYKLNTSMRPIVTLGITSTSKDIKYYNDVIEDQIITKLEVIPGVASASIRNVEEEKVFVEVDLASSTKRTITLTQIKGALQAANLTMPAGILEKDGYAFPVEVPGEFESVDDIKQVLVGYGPEGEQVLLQDIATVYKGFEEMNLEAELDKKSVGLVSVSKQSGANTVAVAEAVDKAIKTIQQEIPEELVITMIRDDSEGIVKMIDSLYSAIITAGIFVIVVVLIFLRRLRSAIIIALTIPTSLIISFLLMYLFEYTINTITLMALTLAIGMVVDNSIVVLENISRKVEAGVERKRAARQGAGEVLLAISASTMTTVAIFAPLIFVSGLVGIMFAQLAFVMVAVLFASLMVSMLFTPMLASKVLKRRLDKQGNPKREWFLPRILDRAFTAFERGYERFVGFTLRYRAVVLILAVAIIATSVVLLRGVGMEFLAEVDSGNIRINLELPVGVDVEKTVEVTEQIVALFDGKPEVERIYYTAGTAGSGISAVFHADEGRNTGSIRVYLVDKALRSVSSKELAAEIMPKLAVIPDLVKVRMSVGNRMSGAMSGGTAMAVEIQGHDLDEIQEVAKEVESIMKQTEGLFNVQSDLTEVNPKVQIDLDRKALKKLGLTVAPVATEISMALYGAAVTRYRGENDDIDVFLTYKEEDRDEIEEIKTIPVKGAGNKLVPLKSFASISYGKTPTSVIRKDQLRIVTVSADTTPGTPVELVGKKLNESLAEVRANHPGLVIHMGGGFEDTADTSFEFLIVILMGILVVYLVMVAQFESFVDPFVVLLSIPFSFSGAFIALVMTGSNLSVNAMMGLLMLVGIVVNNAIVLIDYIQLLRARGLPFTEAITTSARNRLRPIIMTALTTIMGMVPLATGTGEGTEFWVPIGIAVIGGLAFSTVVTLAITPSLYSVFERLRRKKDYSYKLGVKKDDGDTPTPEQGTPATDAPSPEQEPTPEHG